MNFLDSPLDAAAVNYLSFGFLTAVNNLWTWVAVLTAAVSFWKIRASGSSAILYPEEASCDRRSRVGSDSSSTHYHLLSSVSQSHTGEEAVDEQRKPVSEQTTTAGRPFFYDDFVTKGKLTLYYPEENAPACSREMTTTEEMEEGTEDDCEFMFDREKSAWCGSWERMLRLRRGDHGWYRYQDLTVVNGNIVRFWDDCCSGRLF